MDKVKISIIVPVYNVEKYLEECVESILNQTFQNFELILIDDGSTDTSGKKCDRLATEHSKIKVIHKKNGGLSSARNCGIEIAIGEYLMFIDSDDFLLNNKCLMKISQYLNDCDVLQYKMKYFYEKHNKYIELKDIYDITKLDKYSDKINKLVCDGCLSISACDKIVLRKFILENKLFFEEGLISEDVHWSLELYTKEPKIKIINVPIYSYRQQRKDSITSDQNNAKRIESQIRIIEYWYNYNYRNEELRNAYYNYLAYLYLILVTSYSKNYDSKMYNAKIKEYKLLLNYDQHYKVQKAKKLMRIIGYTLTIKILIVYKKLYKKGIIKI